jgi:hypothetical protein
LRQGSASGCSRIAEALCALDVEASELDEPEDNCCGGGEEGASRRLLRVGGSGMT